MKYLYEISYNCHLLNNSYISRISEKPQSEPFLEADWNDRNCRDLPFLVTYIIGTGVLKTHIRLAYFNDCFQPSGVEWVKNQQSQSLHNGAIDTFLFPQNETFLWIYHKLIIRTIPSGR